MVCIDDSAWFLNNFQSLFLVIFLESFRDLSLRDLLGGCMHEPFMVLFPLILLPNPWEKGWGSILGFRCPRVCGVLAGNPSIPLNSTVFGGPCLGYGVPMRCSHYTQSLVRIRGANREIKSCIWRS
jgi:hypothetical protein